MAGYLEVADGQVGYRGDGANHVKYWLDLEPSLNGQPWCACFVSWCLDRAGQISAIGGYPMYSCTAMMNKAKSYRQWAGAPAVGSLAIYDFGSGSPAHVEFVTAVGAGTISAIGGNTSGDLVAHKTRQQSSVLGYWRIEAPPGTYVPGTGDSGTIAIGFGSRVAAPAMTIVGENVDVNARFATPGRAGFIS